MQTQKQTQPPLSLMLSEFNRSLMLIADKSLLVDNFISKIKQLFLVDKVYVFLLDENTGRYKMQNPDEKMSITFHLKDRLIFWLSVNDKELIVSKSPDIIEYFSQEEQEKLSQMKAELVYPLKVMNHISGTVFLGKKIDGTVFDKDEIDLLSLIFNQAAFAIEHASLYELQKERIRKMYRTDRLATLGELAAGAAHEIRNPLTSIRSAIQYLSKDFNNEPVKAEMITEVINEVERINKILQGLLSFARPSKLNVSEVNLESLINQVLMLINSSIRKHHIDVQFEYFTEDTSIQGDMEQLKQVFLNIFLNAIDAMSENRQEQARSLIVSIEKGMAINAGKHYLIINIEDSGKGIEAEDIESIFNPFFTTKEEGTGLGLAISYGIINNHEGEIEVTSEMGKGSCIRIKLPQMNI
jgi:signal transduction histidine kinase